MSLAAYGLNTVHPPLPTDKHPTAPRVSHVQIHLRSPVVFFICRFSRMPFIRVKHPRDTQHGGVEQVVD
jgi:hypothetical protein